jgi:ATPase family associated with various cellular activities (AAA)
MESRAFGLGLPILLACRSFDMISSRWSGLLALLQRIVDQRLESHFKGITPWHSGFAKDPAFQQFDELVPNGTGITYEERVIILLALTPHLQPNFLENLVLRHMPGGGDFPELGGAKGIHHRGMLPSGETAQFILAGADVDARLAIVKLFDTHHFFYQEQALWLEEVRDGEPPMSGRLILSQDWLDRIVFGRETAPRFSSDFPAKLATTPMVWSDLVLNPYTAEQIADVKRWLQYHDFIERDPNLARKIQRGYRVLFFGPPGTGKTLTATLIGKEFERDVYRVDLSQIVSKYIGETEKNLSRIFDRAQNKDWILFFDEADSLFGKRTNVQSSHDKFANQEVSFLLQRIEDFPGLMILASNFKSNIDDAFLRRFHSIVHFPLPSAEERLRLWEQSLPDPRTATCRGDVDLPDLANTHELSGASILNVVHHATLRALGRPESVITQEDLVAGVHRELRKEDRSL